MARLMMSAAEPCSGALIAWRSAPARRAGLASRMPGMKHLRPKIVSTNPVRRAPAFMRSLLPPVARDAGREARRGSAAPPLLVAEAECADAVDDAEIDRLGAPSRLRVHLSKRHAEHLAGGQRVDVVPLLEGALQLGNVGDMRRQAQLDLAVVGRQQQMSGLGD